jgi:hypothetical protein
MPGFVLVLAKQNLTVGARLKILAEVKFTPSCKADVRN